MGPQNWLARVWGPLSRKRYSRRAAEDPRRTIYPEFYVTALEARRVLNAAPMISPQEFGVNENAQAGDIVAAVEAFDSDAGDQLTFAITAGNVKDTFAIDPISGVISVAGKGALSDVSSFALTVEVTDSGGLSSNAEISINVNPSTPGNNPPLINPQRFQIGVDSPEGTTVGELLASDPDGGDRLSFSIVNGNTNGAFEVDPESGVLTVANADEMTTPQTFELNVQVEDRAGETDTATVRIRVNAPPTGIQLDNLTVSENEAGAAVGRITVTDPNSDDQFTFALNDSRFEIVGGQLKLKENESLNFEVEPTIELQVTVTDSGGETFQDLFVLEVMDRNDPPTDIALATNTVAENDPGAVVGLITVVDEDDPATSFGRHTFLVMEGAVGIETPSTRFFVDDDLQLRLVQGVELDFEAEPFVELRIRASDNPDNEGGEPRKTFERTFVIEVLDVNEPPTDIILATDTVAENDPGAVVGLIAVVDEDDPATSFGRHTFLVMEGAVGTDTPSTRFFVDDDLQLRLLPGVELDFEAAPSVELRIRATDDPDNEESEPGGSIERTFVIEVLDVNEPPTDILLSGTVVQENSAGAVIGDITVIDEDGANTPFGTHTFEVREGQTGNTISTRFTVDNNLQLRLIGAESLNFEEEPSVILRIEAIDNPGGGMNRLRVERTFTIEVEDVNDPPVANEKNFSIPKSPPFPGNVLVGGPGDTADFDEDVGDTLTVVLVNGTEFVAGEPIVLPSDATLVIDAQGDFTYDFSTSPLFQNLFEGSQALDSFSYTISDNDGATATATVEIVIIGENIAPKVNPTASALGEESSPRLFSFEELFELIGGVDPDSPPDSLRILITNVKNGELVLTGGDGGPGTMFTFNPVENFNGDLLFNYQVEDRVVPDNPRFSQVGSGTITIAPVNTPPELTIPDIDMTEDLTFESVDILRDNYFDVETPAEDAIFEVVDASPELAAEVTEAGALRIVPLANYNGPGWVVVKVTDAGDGISPPLSVMQTVNIWIAPVDDSPVALDDLYEIKEDPGAPLVGNVLDNDFDVDAIPELNLGLLALPGVTIDNLNELFGIGANSVAYLSPGLPDGAGRVTLPQGGVLQLKSNGSFTYDPAPFFFGVESFEYRVSDAQGNTSTATVNIRVTPVNNAPSFVVDPIIELDPLNPSEVLITNAIVGPPNEAEPNDIFPEAASQTLTFSAVSSNPSFLPEPTFVQVPGDPTTWLMQFPVLPFRSETVTLNIRATDSGEGEGINFSEQQVTVLVILGQVPASSQQFERRAPVEFPSIEPIEIVPSAPVTPALTTTPLQEAAASTQSGTQSEREVLVYLVTSDGSGELTEEVKLTLDPTWLEDLNEIFRELPDDRFRIYLKLEDGSKRLVVDVYVRDGRPFTPDDTGDEVILPEWDDLQDEPPQAPASGVLPEDSNDSSRDVPFESTDSPADLPPILEGPENARPLPELPLGGLNSDAFLSQSEWSSVRWGIAAGGIALMETRKQRQAATTQALADLADRPMRRFSLRLSPHDS